MRTGEMDLADPATLEQFLHFTHENFPSENLLLDLWGHGSGWRGFASDRNKDMTLPQLSGAIDNFLANSTRERIQVVAIDSCSMATLEMSFELEPYVDYLVASEMEVPDYGYSYGEMMKVLTLDEYTSPEGLSVAIGESYIEHSLTYSNYSVSISVVDLSSFKDDFLYAFDQLSWQLHNWTPGINRILGKIRSDTEGYQAGGAFDLGHLLENIAHEEQLVPFRTLAKSVSDAYAETIVYHESYDHPSPKDGVHALNSTGLVVQFYWGYINDDYRSLRLSQVTHWDEFSQGLSDGTPRYALNLSFEDYATGELHLAYKSETTNGTTEMTVFDPKGQRITGNDFILEAEGLLVLDMEYVGWVIPTLTVWNDGRVVSYNSTGRIWAWNAYEDIALDLIGIYRQDGLNVMNEESKTPVAGERTGFQFIISSSNEPWNVTISSRIDGATTHRVVTADPQGTIFTIERELNAGVQTVHFSIECDGMIPDYSAANNVENPYLEVADAVPDNPFVLNVLVKSDAGDEKPLVKVTNVRTGDLLGEGFSQNGVYSLEISPDRYMEGDEVSVEGWTTLDSAVTSKRIYSQDGEGTLSLDLESPQSEYWLTYVLFFVMLLSFFWMAILMRRKDVSHNHR